MSSYDCIVIGAGSAGCAAAARLVQAGAQVLLVEAGGAAGSPWIQAPSAWPFASVMPRFGWGHASEPEAATAGRRLDQPRGRLMGGTSSINGMMYSRGHRADYDGWAALGLEGWAYQDVLPYFVRGESNWRGAGRWHGDKGPLRVASNPAHPLVYGPMLEAARALGYAYNADFNGAEQEGFGLPDFTLAGGRRESGATAYLRDPALQSGLTLQKGTHVSRIVIEQGRATGVALIERGQERIVSAARVVVSAGAFGAPHLLQLSGIGPASALRALGIAPQVDLPGVGRNLQDHPMVIAGFAAAQPLGFEQRLRLDRLAASCLTWLAGQGGLLSDAPMSIQGYVRCLEESTRPDAQFQVSHGSAMSRPWFPGWRRPTPDMFGVAALQLQPEARGSVTLRSADPLTLPEVRLGFLESAHDRRMARAMLRFIRRFFAAEPLRGLVGVELLPGPDHADDDALDAFIAGSILSGAHQVGTCAMGIDPAQGAVVDARLRVHGVEDLFVADASVMPRIVSGNTSAPAMMIGERCADFLTGHSPAQSPVLAEAHR